MSEAMGEETLHRRGAGVCGYRPLAQIIQPVHFLLASECHQSDPLAITRLKAHCSSRRDVESFAKGELAWEYQRFVRFEEMEV